MGKLLKFSATFIVFVGGIIMLSLVAVGAIRLIQNIERRETEEVRQHMLSLEERWFVTSPGRFEFQLTIDGETHVGINYMRDFTSPRSANFNPHFNELAVVRTQEEAQGFPDNVIVAWPKYGESWERLLEAVNWVIERTEEESLKIFPNERRPFGVEAFEEIFSFSHPLDMSDVVDNFEQFLGLWYLIESSLTMITVYEHGGINEFPPQEWQQRLAPVEPATDYSQPNVPITETGAGITQPQQALLDKFNYAYNFYFQFNDIDSVRAKIDPTNPAYDPSYTDIVFLQTSAEAESMPEDTIAAWLPEEQITTQFIHMIHSALSFTEDELDILGEVLRDVITLEQFGLSYPLQPSDLVDNWEKVNALWNALKPIEQYTIRAFALKEK